MMLNKKKEFHFALISLTVAFIIIGIFFLISTIVWICITDNKMTDFPLVLSNIIKNIGSYSSVLIALIVSVFFSSYFKEKDIQNSNKIKIESIGYFTLAFSMEEVSNLKEFNERNFVQEIDSFNDYKKIDYKGTYPVGKVKFLTSKDKRILLKNIMVFSSDYFEKNRNEIVSNYYKYCEKIEYSTPLYCEAKPYFQKDDPERNEYFWIILKMNSLKQKEIRTVWIGALTEEGVLFFVKLKYQVKKFNNGYSMDLLQQTIYYKSENGLVPLVK